MLDYISSLAADLHPAGDGRWFWLVGLIAFGGCAISLRTIWPSRRSDHARKDFDGYIDDLLSTNGSRIRRRR